MGSGVAVRWLEWGMRSYENFALGFAVLLFAVAVLRTVRVLRPVGSTIVLAEVVNAVWMTCLLVVEWRAEGSSLPRHAAPGALS